MMTETTKAMRPDFCTDEMLKFLDDLRESGETNMLGAGPYLDSEFPELWVGMDSPRDYRSSPHAGEVLMYWMKTFGQADR